ncbi:hypothetical protein AA0472_2276 [Acetobacter estunensis NRIC 0472]|nr:hypothetical protein AA0472_2276 [Acetobacter estunensis NRIC 0472]
MDEIIARSVYDQQRGQDGGRIVMTGKDRLGRQDIRRRHVEAAKPLCEPSVLPLPVTKISERLWDQCWIEAVGCIN